jgi:pyruvate/2-oxoglutarate dehydrogenase complex dihydrolipoamide acyltransferase (E2) component
LTALYLRQYKPHTMPNVSLVLADLDLGEIPVLACSWLADQGARVTQGDRLLEVVAGEVCVDLEAPATGRLVQRCVGPEERLTVGQVLAVIATS